MAAPPDLRWQTAGDDGPQAALFDDVVERHVGRGEYRGLEFLHVDARRIINQVPAASRMPFRYTINAYRGCSHACTYCLGPDTPVLLAGGGTRPIAELRVGEQVVGTRPGGGRRRGVATPVLAHWATVKPAYRITLDDGTALVASGDHRFLTTGGWRHVDAGPQGATGHPGLSGTDRLVAIGDATGWRQVSTVEALGLEMPMYDITTGTGDFVAAGVVSHNCFARPTHEYLGMNAGDDFERRIVVKVNAVERLRAELAPARWAGDHIAMGTNTDPYQRAEGKYRLTQGIVGELVRAANPFSILTKSTLILRDLDLLAEAARVTSVRANFSIGTLDEEVWKLTEPGTPHPRQRVEAVARLVAAGVPCGVLVAPVLPGLSDHPAQLEAVVEACVEAGAASITPLMLHLRPGVREHYLGWLAGARPELTAGHQRLYSRPYAPRSRQQQLSRLVADMVARHRGRTASPQPPGAAPRRSRPTAPAPARQLTLEM